MYLLDDVLSAVDPPVASWLLEHAICGPLLSGKTTVLCSHSDECSQAADMVLKLSHGALHQIENQATIDRGSLETHGSTASEVSEL